MKEAAIDMLSRAEVILGNLRSELPEEGLTLLSRIHMLKEENSKIPLISETPVQPSPS